LEKQQPLRKKIYCVYSGDGNQDTLKFTGTEAKYVKWEGFDRHSARYSISEFEIYLSDGNEYPETCPTGYRSNLINEPDIGIYPNPARNKIIIEFSQALTENATINLMDPAGKVVYSAKYKQSIPSNLTLDLSEFTKGLYFLRIRQDSNVWIEKLIVY
jgi:hypothetical protein